MSSRLNALRQFGLMAAMTTLTCVSLAAGRLTAVEIQPGQGGNDKVVLKIAGGPVSITPLRFPDAHQGVLVLKQTELGLTQKAWKETGQSVRALALRPLEGPDGTPSVQVTLDLAVGTDFQFESKPDQVIVTVGRAEKPAPVSAASDPAAVSLSNVDLAQVKPTDADPTGRGQDPAKTPPDAKGPQFYTPEAVPKAAPATPEEREMLLAESVFQQRVSLDFKDAELQNVIRLLAAKTNLNIILTKDQVRGTITLKLTNVPLGTALDSILKSNNLSFVVEQGGIVRIVPLAQVRTDKVEMRTEYIPINWVTAGNLVTTLKPFLSSEGRIQPDTDSNGIIVTDVPAKVQQITKLVERIDLPEKQVMIEMRLVDLTDAARRELGFNWRLFRNSTEVFIDPLTGDQQRLIFADDFAKRGVDIDTVTASNFYRSTGNTFDIFGNEYMLDYQLSALEERRQAQVLANPKIVTLNNLLARIEIVKQNPYISAQQTGENSVGTVEFKDTGVILQVTPNITNNGYVRMLLQPEQMVKKGDFKGFSNTFVPIIDTRKVESSVIVKDEETVVLGGLRQLDSSNSEEGVPFLMRLPVLGWFFKDTLDQMEKTELVLFVTPHIVKDPTLSANELRQYEQIDYNWDLPDYFYDESHLRTEPPAEKKQ